MSEYHLTFRDLYLTHLDKSHQTAQSVFSLVCTLLHVSVITSVKMIWSQRNHRFSSEGQAASAEGRGQLEGGWGSAASSPPVMVLAADRWLP